MYHKASLAQDFISIAVVVASFWDVFSISNEDLRLEILIAKNEGDSRIFSSS